jgi:hypothetical protein
MTDTEKTRRVFMGTMEGIEKRLVFPMETGGDFKDCWLPILDTSLRVDKETNMVLYKFIEKPKANKEETALGENSKNPIPGEWLHPQDGELIRTGWFGDKVVGGGQWTLGSGEHLKNHFLFWPYSFSIGFIHNKKGENEENFHTGWLLTWKLCDPLLRSKYFLSSKPCLWYSKRSDLEPQFQRSNR